MIDRGTVEYLLWNETAFPFDCGRKTAHDLGKAVARCVAWQRQQPAPDAEAVRG